MSNVSLIKVDKAEGGGSGRKGGENMEVKRSKGDETRKSQFFFCFFFFFCLFLTMFLRHCLLI